MDATLFTVPQKFIGKIANGALKRIGGNLHDAASGQIVGHLQEAGDLASNLPVPTGLNPFSVVTEVINTGSSLYENYQNEKIIDLLESLQMMTGITMALSAVNLGVSAVGFVVMSKKLDGLKLDLERVDAGVSRIDDFVQQIDLRQRNKDRSTILSLMKQGDEAWEERDGTWTWRDLARRLHGEEHYYRTILGHDGVHDQSVFLHASIPLQEAISAHEALARLVAARVKTLVILNEIGAALAYAEEFRDWLRDRFLHFTAPAIVDARYQTTATREGKPVEIVRIELLPIAQRFIQLVREQQSFADSTVELLKTLLQRDVDGKAYVRALKEERDHPILIIERPQ
jgi:hypothetical protein